MIQQIFLIMRKRIDLIVLLVCLGIVFGFWRAEFLVHGGATIQNNLYLGVGVLACLVIYGLSWSFFRAKRLANQITNELTEKSRFIDLVLENLPLGIAVNLISSGKTTYMNKAFAQVYGWEQKDLTSVDDFFVKVYPDPAIREETKKMILADVASGDPARMHWDNVEIRTKIGEKRHVKAQNIPLPEQGLMISTVEDVTESSNKMDELAKLNTDLESNKIAMVNLLEDARELEEALKNEKEGVEKKVVERTSQLADEQAKLIAAISALPRAFLILDKDGVIVAQNGRLTEIFGEQKEAWSLNLIGELLAEGFDLKEKISEVMKEQKVINRAEFQVGAKFLEVFIAPVLNSEKELIGAVLTIKDATEEKVMSRSKDEFFSIASHELRTPLTAIRGNTSLMLEYYQEALKDPDLRQLVTDTHDASIRLIGIVNDFLDMSRLEMGKIDFKLAPVDLPALIEETLKEYQVTGSRQKLSLEMIPPAETIPPVMADRDRLRQVLINLVGNGIKFTKEGGISIELHVEGKQVAVWVKDTGTGIPLVNQGLLFHKFQQAGSSLSTRDTSKGTGLGLYISRLLCEGMGGKLELVSSEEGKGSTFAVRLPIAG